MDRCETFRHLPALPGMKKQMKLAIFAIVALAQAADGSAGTAYSVRHSRGTAPSPVVADSGKIRVDLVRPPDTVVTADTLLYEGSGPLIALNSEDRTWYDIESPRPFALSSRYLTPLAENPAARKVRLEFNEAAGDAPGERRYSGRLTYDVYYTVMDAEVKVLCAASFEVTTTDRHDRRDWLGGMLPRTGYPAVDEKFREAESAIRGFPLLMTLKANRAYGGGPGETDTMKIEVLDIREVTPPASTFARPAGYRYQPPVMALPGQ